jgi:hypothetical protein
MVQGVKPAGAIGTTSWLRLGTAVALAVLAAVIVWLIVRGADDMDGSSGVSSTASAATLSTLRSLPGELGHDVYWAGVQPSRTRELTEVDGNIYIRYLPRGIRAGDPRPDYLTVGTYPTARAYTSLRRRGRQPGNGSRRAAGGGIAVWSDSRPQTVYLAYPRSVVQIEVYDPSAARARRLATTGAVKPIR